MDSVALRVQPRSPKIATLIGAQYFMIFHHHPVAILGFLQLEKYHPQRAAVELLIGKTGLPRAGFHQLLLQTEVDVGHAQALDELVDSLPLEPPHERVIGLKAFQMVELLTDALLDLFESGAIGVTGRRSLEAHIRGNEKKQHQDHHSDEWDPPVGRVDPLWHGVAPRRERISRRSPLALATY